MTPRRVLTLLAAALVAILGSMYLSSLRHLDRDTHGGAFLPGLDAQLDNITDVRLRKGSDKPLTSLHRTAPGHWVIGERGDYPADTTKIKRLLLALADTKIVEEKTSNPASYAVLGVEDATAANAGGTEVSLVMPGKSTAVIIGHPVGNGNYVRREGEAASYSVEPAIPLESAPRDWIDSKLLEVPFEKIEGLRVHLADGTAYHITRLPPVQKPAAPAAANAAGGAAAPSAASVPAPGATAPSAAAAPPAATTPAPSVVQNEGFKLDSVPRGREAAEANMIAPSPTSFSGVPADDVAAVSSIDFGKPSVAELALSDGSVLTLTGTTAGDKHWITLQSTKDEALNAKTRGRAFEIASYRYDALFRPLEQLLKPKPAKPEPAAKPAKAAKSGAKPATAEP